MKVSAEMKYLGFEEGTNREGKTFFVVGLLQGFSSERIFINDEDLKKKLQAVKPMSDCVCDLNISIGEKTYVNLVDIRQKEGR